MPLVWARYGWQSRGVKPQWRAKASKVGLSRTRPPSLPITPGQVARVITDVVGAERGTRPFRVHVDPADDGAEEVNAVGADFTLNAFRRREETDRIRDAQDNPGCSAHTPVVGIRGAIGEGLRAIADRYFTAGRLSQDNIPGYRRIGS